MLEYLQYGNTLPLQPKEEDRKIMREEIPSGMGEV